MKRRKNHMIITGLALLIAAAGYLNYTQYVGKSGGTVQASGTVEDETSEAGKASSKEETKEPGQAVYTAVQVSKNLSQMKLERDQTRAKSKESLMKIVEDKSLDEAQKKSAVDKIVSLTENSEKEADAEAMLAAQGFEDTVVKISEENVDIITTADATDSKERAKIENIVKRVTGCSPEHIIITPIEEN